MDSDTNASSTRRSIGECVGEMYLDNQLADIHFSFPNEKTNELVPAHKMLLVAKSPVFKAMFCGKLAEKGTTIKITDITPKIFKLMLKHVYTDKLTIGADNVGALLHASQKYQLESLTHDCEKYLKQNLGLHNACTVLQQATDFALYDLANTAHHYMCENTTDIVMGEDFLSLSQENLQRCLECEEFVTDEILIFKAVMRWLESKMEDEMMETQTNPPSPKKRTMSRKRKADSGDEGEKNEDKDTNKDKQEKQRKILGDILYQIRYYYMSVREFNEIVCPSGILTDSEQLVLLRHILSAGHKKEPRECGEFNMYSRCEAKKYLLRNIYSKLPDRPGIVDTFPKNLRNCIRIHFFSSKPFKILNLNILPHKSFGHYSVEFKKGAAFIQIKGTSFGKKYMLDFSEYCNQYIVIDQTIEANKEVVLEVIITEEDGLVTNKSDGIFETHDCFVPDDKDNWIKQDIAANHELKIACEGINIVEDFLCYPVI